MAKLRTLHEQNSSMDKPGLIHLLQVNLASGHFRNADRFVGMREDALELAFLFQINQNDSNISNDLLIGPPMRAT